MRLISKLRRLLFDPDTLSPPPGFAPGPTDVSLAGRGCVEITGCKGIELYEERRIRLRVKEGILSVSGSDLTLKTYHGKNIAVCGRIDAVCFEDPDAQNGGEADV